MATDNNQKETEYENLISKNLSRLNMSQSDLAKRIGVETENNNPTISYYIHGKRTVPEEKLIKMAEELEIDKGIFFKAYENHLKTKEKKIPDFLKTITATTIAVPLIKSTSLIVPSIAMPLIGTVSLIAPAIAVGAAIGGFVGKFTTNKAHEKINPSDGPFGLKKELTVDDINNMSDKTTPVEIENGIYIITPPRVHSAFSKYFAYIHPEFGLYCIEAQSSEINTSDIKEKYDNIKTRFENIYDKSTDNKEINAVIWTKENNKRMNDNNIKTIILGINDENKLVYVQYVFDNIDDIYKQQQEEEDKYL